MSATAAFRSIVVARSGGENQDVVGQLAVEQQHLPTGHLEVRDFSFERSGVDGWGIFYFENAMLFFTQTGLEIEQPSGFIRKRPRFLRWRFQIGFRRSRCAPGRRGGGPCRRVRFQSRGRRRGPGRFGRFLL